MPKSLDILRLGHGFAGVGWSFFSVVNRRQQYLAYSFTHFICGHTFLRLASQLVLPQAGERRDFP